VPQPHPASPGLATDLVFAVSNLPQAQISALNPTQLQTSLVAAIQSLFFAVPHPEVQAIQSVAPQPRACTRGVDYPLNSTLIPSNDTSTCEFTCNLGLNPIVTPGGKECAVYNPALPTISFSVDVEQATVTQSELASYAQAVAQALSAASGVAIQASQVVPFLAPEDPASPNPTASTVSFTITGVDAGQVQALSADLATAEFQEDLSQAVLDLGLTQLDVDQSSVASPPRQCTRGVDYPMQSTLAPSTDPASCNFTCDPGLDRVDINTTRDCVAFDAEQPFFTFTLNVAYSSLTAAQVNSYVAAAAAAFNISTSFVAAVLRPPAPYLPGGGVPTSTELTLAIEGLPPDTLATLAYKLTQPAFQESIAHISQALGVSAPSVETSSVEIVVTTPRQCEQGVDYPLNSTRTTSANPLLCNFTCDPGFNFLVTETTTECVQFNVSKPLFVFSINVPVSSLTRKQISDYTAAVIRALGVDAARVTPLLKLPVLPVFAAAPHANRRRLLQHDVRSELFHLKFAIEMHEAPPHFEAHKSPRQSQRRKLLAALPETTLFFAINEIALNFFYAFALEVMSTSFQTRINQALADLGLGPAVVNTRSLELINAPPMPTTTAATTTTAPPPPTTAAPPQTTPAGDIPLPVFSTASSNRGQLAENEHSTVAAAWLFLTTVALVYALTGSGDCY
jgi:hypothetical protein